MDARDAYQLPHSPLPALTRAAILIESLAGVAVALLLDTGWDDEGWFRFAPALAMAVVAISSLVVMRVALAGAATAAAERGASIGETSTTLHALALGFGTAPATYGLVSAFITGEWWVPVAFGAFAMLAQALFFSQVQAELARLRIKQQTGATS